MERKKKKIVIINQAANYLTIGICNEFAKQFDQVALITGSVHVQGEELDASIKVKSISKWKEEHGIGKIIIYLKALYSFFILLLTKYRKYEVFFISVPPMAYLLNIVLPNRFSMLIWDVYPDGLKIIGLSEKHIVYRIWSKLNRISFKKSYKLFTISDNMADLLEKYIDRDKLIVQPIWSIFQSNNKVQKENNPFVAAHHLEGKFIVQYSGNIGVTHNVEMLVHIAERMQEYTDILFQIIGRGPRKALLQKMVEEKKLKNCQFLPFQSDEMFPFSLSAADLGVVILDEITAKGSVPSKSYNLMSYGIPSLYISAKDSELNHYAVKYKHAECFSKNDEREIVDFIENLSHDINLQKKYSSNAQKASENFKRENAKKIVDKYLK